MLISIYIFLLVFKILATGLCAVLCYGISRNPLSPTTTYLLFSVGFALRLALQMLSVFYTQDILGFLRFYPAPLIVVTQGVEVAIVTCFLIGLFRRFRTYKDLPDITPLNK